MLSRPRHRTAPAGSGLAFSRKPLPRMSTLALAIALAAGCSDGTPAADAAASPSPAVTATAHEAAPAGANDHAAVVQDAQHATVVHDEHAAHAPEGTSATLPATPWPSDAPLRVGMRRMHRAVDALGHAEHDHLDAAQATAAAQQVEDAASYMIANCKLAREPDAALHGVLATLMRGAAAIKRNPADTTPVAAMREAVALYPRMFEDATWQADTATSD